MSSEFEWDLDKTTANQEGQGVSFVEAAIVFFDPLSVTVADPMHSIHELRL